MESLTHIGHFLLFSDGGVATKQRPFLPECVQGFSVGGHTDGP